MNHTDIPAAAEALLADPSARAVLVYPDDDGSLALKPVAYGQSIIAIERDLLDHLSARPLNPAFLHELRAYCDSRLEASAQARDTGGFVIPDDRGWRIAHVGAFQPLPGASA